MRRPPLIASLLAAAALGSGLLAQAPPPDDAARERGMALAREMVAAAGGMNRWKAIRDVSLTLRTTAFDVGPSGSLVSSIRASFTKEPRLMLRVDVPIGKSLHTKVFDGLEAWMAVDGALLRRGDSTYRRIRDMAHTYFIWISFPFNLLDEGTAVEHRGSGTVDGQEVELLQVRFGEASGTVAPDDVYQFAVSRATHLTVREQYYMRGERENVVETVYGDYRAEGGIVKEHLRQIVASVSGRPLQKIEVEELQFGDHLSRDLFRKPPDPTTDAAPPG